MKTGGIASYGRKLGYARVSTREQNLRMQCDALHSAGCDLLFDDQGVSGKHEHRPGLDAMLAELQPGDMVVVYSLDRLGRSVLHLADMLVRFREDGVHFHALNEGINTSTPGGKLVYHVFSAVAEFQREIIVENTAAGLEAARRRGKRLGRPPMLSPEKVALVHSLYRRRRMNKDQIAARLSVSRSTLDRAFARLEATCGDDAHGLARMSHAEEGPGDHVH
ncbi:MAG: hypothetical protein TEF_21995 [Rhizobiales bacterium NRL2]|jgi:DNA invertase Pin-like site-specific DNA recombinase|nr:MAG: hypothetical protein TEF_21995 [Rhizobiales bacterium NRL2]